MPTIGGGVSREVLPAVINSLIDQGVDRNKLTVVVTQHGNSEEVNAALDGRSSENPTCGLRGVIKKIEDGEKVNIPPGLGVHAGAVNVSSRIINNAKYVFDSTRNNFKDLGIRVLGGFFDHEGDDENGKSLEITLGVDQPISITLHEQTAWHERHQDPRALVVSVGVRAAALSDGVILPETVGLGVNNDFNSAAVDRNSFIYAMWEQWYALSHVGGHGEDKNFAHTELMVLLYDGEEQLGWIKEFMGWSEFKRDFSPYIGKLKDSGFYLIDLSSESVVFQAVS